LSKVAIDEQAIPKFAVFFAYAYLFIYYTRPQDNVPGLDLIPWVGALFLLMTIWGWSRVRFEYFSSPFGLVFWLGIAFVLSGMGAISVISYKMGFKWIFQTFPQCIMLFTVFCTAMRFRSLLTLWSIIYFVMAVFTIKNAPLGPGDFTRDPNDAAMALSMGIPFVFYANTLSGLSRWRRVFNYLTIALLFYAIVLTSSRGGFLGLVAVLLTMWWLSQSRVKIAALASVLIISGGALLITLLPSQYIADMKSINDKNDSTRIERFRSWEIGWLMFKDNPLLGVGAGNYSNTVHLYQEQASWWTGREKSLSGRQSHSLYFQVLPDLGLAGVLIYGYIIFVAPLKLLLLRKKLVGHPQEELLLVYCNAMVAAMASYAIAGAFISVAYYPHLPIWITMYSILMWIYRKGWTSGLPACDKEPFLNKRF
jgi:O-antigen ligase